MQYNPKLVRYISTHAINRYKQRVVDDLQRDRLTRRDLARKIRRSLHDVKDVETLPQLKDSYVAEVYFNVKGSKTRPYFCVLQRERRNMEKWTVVTILTQEMYENSQVDSILSDI